MTTMERRTGRVSKQQQKQQQQKQRNRNKMNPVSGKRNILAVHPNVGPPVLKF